MKDFIDRHFRHFNALALRNTATSWVRHAQRGGRMVLSLGGAMSTAELGISIAELIREGLIHAISTTGANLEEDLFCLVARSSYHTVPNYRDLTPDDERNLLVRRLNRVTDTCIPEAEAIAPIDRALLPLYQQEEQAGRSHQPFWYVRRLILDGALKPYCIDPDDSWVVAAAQHHIPVWAPGWEDSTLGNGFAAHVMNKNLQGYTAVTTGPEILVDTARWYQDMTQVHPAGFFQVGGGISGDYAIATVPLLRQELNCKVPLWAWFAQISEATTSYGSYSGAPPNEKITWEKLGTDTPRHTIESDATICFPLIAHYVLEGMKNGDSPTT